MGMPERLECFKNFHFVFCENVIKYEKVSTIAEGRYGEVAKAVNKFDNKTFVVMKKITFDMEKHTFPITPIREIKHLQRLGHQNIVQLIEICRSNLMDWDRHIAAFYVVYEYCEHDLAKLLGNEEVKFKLVEIKKVLHQILKGLRYMHVNNIVHRNVKTANVLLNIEGIVKLADYGFTRSFGGYNDNEAKKLQNHITTLWYRAPELLLSDRSSGSTADLWSLGCVMAEMWTRSPIMTGTTEQEQLVAISKLCGSINSEISPMVTHSEMYSHVVLPPGHKRRVVERLKPFLRDHLACDLLDKLLIIDPIKRINTDDAINHAFFLTEPGGCDLRALLMNLPASVRHNGEPEVEELENPPEPEDLLDPELILEPLSTPAHEDDDDTDFDYEDYLF